MKQRSIFLWALVVVHVWTLSDGYRNIHLQDYLCADKLLIALQKPFRGDPWMTLTEDRDSAAIITQSWNVTLPGVYTSNRKIKYDCKFRVQTPEKKIRGIYMVLTRLKFRQDPVTGACRDYIQFSGGNRSPSDQLCMNVASDGVADRMIFDQRDQSVNVHIHIDKEHMITEPLELRMVLTAHSECRFSGDFLCDPKNKYSCISRHFVRDNITNCHSPCRDEVSCLYDAIAVKEYDTTNVAISAITSLIFTMLGVGFCVWICWKYWNCITVQQHAHEASAAAHRRAQNEVPTIEMPTAPRIDDFLTVNTGEAHSPQTPKDLPPSYESLFPES